MTNLNSFKAYDIRGIYPDQLDEPKVYAIGRAYATLIKRELQQDNITIAVGSDMRLSSPSLKGKQSLAAENGASGHLKLPQCSTG